MCRQKSYGMLLSWKELEVNLRPSCSNCLLS